MATPLQGGGVCANFQGGELLLVRAIIQMMSNSTDFFGGGGDNCLKLQGEICTV